MDRRVVAAYILAAFTLVPLVQAFVLFGDVRDLPKWDDDWDPFPVILIITLAEPLAYGITGIVYGLLAGRDGEPAGKRAAVFAGLMTGAALILRMFLSGYVHDWF